MDIRTYFKGDNNAPLAPPIPPKSPPKPPVFELPELFISASNGVKRSRSTVAESIDDIVHEHAFVGNVHRVLSPLEVRVVQNTEPKPIQAPAKRKV